MISYDGSDFTSASLSKKCSPRGRDPTHCEGKVLKSVFVPNIGWASQVCVVRDSVCHSAVSVYVVPMVDLCVCVWLCCLSS